MKIASLVILLLLVALGVQDAWVKYECLHPKKEAEAAAEVVALCKKSSWAALLVESFKSTDSKQDVKDGASNTPRNSSS